MRICTWNQAGGPTVDKLGRVLSHRPSLVALQEAPRPTQSAAFRGPWHGNNRHRGVALLSFHDLTARVAHKARTRAMLFLPCQVSGAVSFNVLVVWAKPWYYRPSYVSSLVRGLSAYASFIQSAPTIVLGDFNSNPCFGESHFEWVRLLDDLGLVSAYHLHTGEPPGRERRPTYFHRATGGEPYHIDYCFIPKTWTSHLVHVTVGRKSTWSTSSDHVPLIVDLNLP